MLAERLRPKSLDEVLSQQQLLGESMALRLASGPDGMAGKVRHLIEPLSGSFVPMDPGLNPGWARHRFFTLNKFPVTTHPRQRCIDAHFWLATK